MGHQLRICRHLSRGHDGHLLSKKMVVLRRVEDEGSMLVLGVVKGKEAVGLWAGGRVEGVGLLEIKRVRIHGNRDQGKGVLG